MFLRAEAASIIILSGISAYVVAEWTPLRHLSVGTGIGADHMTLFPPLAGNQPPGGSGKTLRNAWTGLSVPLVVGVQFIDAAKWNEPRRKPALRLGLEFAAGVEPRSWIFGWHGSLTIGFVQVTSPGADRESQQEAEPAPQCWCRYLLARRLRAQLAMGRVLTRDSSNR